MVALVAGHKDMTMTRPRRGIVETPPEEAPQRLSQRRLPERGDLGNGPRCPEVPSHGKTFWMSSGRFYCPHSDHMGLLATQPGGPTPPTKCFFTPEEAGER